MSRRSMRMTGMLLAFVLALAVTVMSQVAAQVATPMSEQPVTIAGSEITWSGDWTYTIGTSATISEQVTFSQTEIETQVLKALSYGVMPAEAGAGADAVIESFTETFLEGGAIDINEVTTGQLEDGTVWKVFTMNVSEDDSVAIFNDGPLAALITASQGGDGGYVITSLTVQAHLLQDSISQVQAEFVLNGDGQLFGGIDPGEVTADLPTEETSVGGAEPEATDGATPLASPEITVVDSSAATPPGSPEAVQVVCPDATPALTAEEATLAAVQDGAGTATPLATPGAGDATPNC